jgi:hypothetical protein
MYNLFLIMSSFSCKKNNNRIFRRFKYLICYNALYII